MNSQAVILIPGIKGTKLVDTNRPSHDVIWSGLQSEWESIQDLELTEQHEGAHYDQARDVIIRPGEIEGLAYAEFLRDLRTDKPTYIFHYDWRMTAVESGRKLAEFLDYLIEKSHASGWPTPIERFDFVTHSLGNFVLRAFLNEYEHDLVNKVVFTVPPFKGSLEIVTAVLVGQGFFSWTKEKTRKIIRTQPGALELLPTYEGAGVFARGGQPVEWFNAGHWQKNVTNLRDDTPARRTLARKFRNALAVAGETVSGGVIDLKGLPKPLRDRMLVIARDGYATLQSVDVVKNRRGEPGNLVDLKGALRDNRGDGSVAHASSCCYHKQIVTLMITSSWFHQEHGHAFILNDERVQRLISRFLADGAFNHQSPGSSVKRVVDLRPVKNDPTKGWDAVLG